MEARLTEVVEVYRKSKIHILHSTFFLFSPKEQKENYAIATAVGITMSWGTIMWSWLCPWLALGPWTCPLNSPGLRFPSVK